MSSAPIPYLNGTIRQKTVHVIVFDVSGSMKAPLKLRSNAQDADKGSDKLESKRVQTMFDVICRLADDGIAAGKNQDMYAAALCFGLRNISTCDLLALLEERTKVLELLDLAQEQSTSQLPYSQATALLTARGISSSEAQSYLNKVSSSKLYTVVGREPLVKLLADAGAPCCEKYVETHLSPEAAGKYFMAFTLPERAKDLEKLVAQLPEACKSDWSPGLDQIPTNLMKVVNFQRKVFLEPTKAFGAATRSAIDNTGFIGAEIQARVASEAIQFADLLLGSEGQGQGKGQNRQDVKALLKRIPTATPRLLSDIVRLIKRLQSALGPATGDERASSQDWSINWERLLNDIEPYLYGGTPMCETLSSVSTIFDDGKYSSKVLVLISDGDATDGNPLSPARSIREAGGLIFACLLTDSPIEEPRRLRGFDEPDNSWPSEARSMFDMASTVSCDSGPVQALRRRGWRLPISGKCKLFVQANNPIIVDEFTTASRSLGTSSDALADMIGEVSLDKYIRKSNNDAKATDQRSRSICWAHATASVFHLASHRVVGREVPDFYTIRADLLKKFGDNDDGQSMSKVLKKSCRKYRLHYLKCNEEGARTAIHARRPVIATFVLDDNHWDKFSAFFKSTPKGTLTARDMIASVGGDDGGHAVVLVRCDDTSLTFMNSWGHKFANNGFFSVDKASTLEIAGGPHVRFYDVYWTTDDLSAEEVTKFKAHGVNKGQKIAGALPKSFHDLPVVCPHCKTSAPTRKFDGSWFEAKCRTCKRTFTPTVGALIKSLYSSNCD